MTGDDKVRFCGDCKKNVYNVTAMTRLEAESLLEKNGGGDMCVRFYERPDGTILTSDCPVGVERKQRRKLALAVLGGTAMWGASLAAAAGVVSASFGKPKDPSSAATTALSPQALPGTLRVTGESGTRVMIDGEIAATLPAALFQLQAGTHRVTLHRAEGGAPEEHFVTITAGEITTLSQGPRFAQPVAVPPVVVRPEGRWMAGGIRGPLTHSPPTTTKR